VKQSVKFGPVFIIKFHLYFATKSQAVSTLPSYSEVPVLLAEDFLVLLSPLSKWYNVRMDFHEICYGRYAIGGLLKSHTFQLVPSVTPVLTDTKFTVAGG
jgi:hypothetical protein